MEGVSCKLILEKNPTDLREPDPHLFERRTLYTGIRLYGAKNEPIQVLETVTRVRYPIW